jgi:hypothetical protein
MKLLLDWKSTTTKDGVTPLHEAAFNASLAGCKLLINARAGVNARFVRDDAIMTFARCVAAYGEPRLMQLLIDSGILLSDDNAAVTSPLTAAVATWNRQLCEFHVLSCGRLRAGRGIRSPSYECVFMLLSFASP